MTLPVKTPYIERPVPPANENEYREVAWGLVPEGDEGSIKSFYINRGVPSSNDVKFTVEYCGICHSDVHHGLNHLSKTVYPVVPGHELVGTVTEIGADVKGIKVGDHVGVGVFVDACLNCGFCKGGDEQYCEKGKTLTYNGVKAHGRVGGNVQTQTFGGYSGSFVVNENFVAKIPENIPLEKAGPLLCAAITMYDPLRHWGATVEGKKIDVGIVGIGGLGTMGLKLAKALGHTVYAISSSPNKKDLAHQKGADVFVISNDEESMKSNSNKMDIILNTVSAPHDVNTYLGLLKSQGTLVQLGLVTEPHTVNQLPLIFQRKQIAGSCIGGMASLREVLELCSKHNITPDVEIVTADKISDIWEKLSTSNDDGIRYVIDIQKSLQEPNTWNECHARI